MVPNLLFQRQLVLLFIYALEGDKNGQPQYLYMYFQENKSKATLKCWSYVYMAAHFSGYKSPIAIHT